MAKKMRARKRKVARPPGAPKPRAIQMSARTFEQLTRYVYQRPETNIERAFIAGAAMELDVPEGWAFDHRTGTFTDHEGASEKAEGV